MAKKRSRKKYDGPDPINDLIDIAGALLIGYFGQKRRQKRGYKKTRIDPYAATSTAFALGKLETTEELLKFGGMLGAMGAFDPVEENTDLGERYGVCRDDYASRDEYVEALNSARFDASGVDAFDETDDDIAFGDTTVLCCVSRLDNGKTEQFLSDDDALCPGDRVLVPDGKGGTAEGIVVTVKTTSIEERGMDTEIRKIIGKV